MLNNRNSGARQTIVDTDTRIEGDIKFVGAAFINGHVNGSVTARKGEDATLNIREHGHVTGSVAAPHLVINGTVEGEVHATERLELGPQARVIGDVRYKLLKINVGAELDGSLIYQTEPKVVRRIDAPRSKDVNTSSGD